METYAVISVGGKQYRVREGQRLLVDRVAVDEGKSFHPDLLMLGGDGDPKLGDGLDGQQVTAKVAGHVLGDKVIVGKHKKRTGYRRPTGFRARLSQIEIESIGRKATRSTTTKKKATAAAKKPATRSTTRTTPAKKSED